MAVNMAGRSSLSAGPSSLQASETKKKVCSTVNVGPLPNVSCCRRADVLQPQENIVDGVGCLGGIILLLLR